MLDKQFLVASRVESTKFWISHPPWRHVLPEAFTIADTRRADAPSSAASAPDPASGMPERCVPSVDVGQPLLSVGWAAAAALRGTAK